MDTGTTTIYIYIAAKLRASDAYLGFGAEWAYYDCDGGFKIAAVPEEDAPWLTGRLRSGLDLFGSASSDTLAGAITAAEDIAGLYDTRGRVE